MSSRVKLLTNNDAASRRDATAIIFDSFFALARSIDRFHQYGGLRTAAGVNLDRALHPVLITIGERGPLRSTALAQALALKNSTISRHAGKLVDLKLVKRTEIDDDRRASLLSVTEDGALTLQAIRSAWEEHIELTLVKIGSHDPQRFAKEFQALATALGQYDLTSGDPESQRRSRPQDGTR